MDLEEILFEVEEEARREMLLSGYKKPINTKVTDLGLWKKGQVHESRGFHYTIYKCPMNVRAGCRCMLRLVRCNDFMELQRSELRHQADSHEQDCSKRLKYAQMVAIREAVVTAPQLSAVQLRRNMLQHDSPTKTIPPELLRSVRHQVYRTRKELGARQLKGFELDDSFGKLQEFADTHMWSTLVLKHNDPEDDFHIGLHDFCVIGHQNEAALDVLRLNLASLWTLSHAFRALKAGWGFQLNADVTGKICNKSVDLVAFSVTSMPKRNNTMCLCIIPSTTESEQMYKVVYNELRKAVCLLPSIRHCGEEDCVSCNIITDLMADAEVSEYLRSQKFADCKLPVTTAMCDNFKGWGNFSETNLGLKANICLAHVVGNIRQF
jgi:hypothetical protein